MKYRALVERLNWKGEIVHYVREYEDKFAPDLSAAVRDYALTGKIDLGALPEPYIDHIWDFMSKIAPSQANETFDSQEFGIRAIAGEFYPGLGAQLVWEDGKFKWRPRSRDLIEEEADRGQE